jgi:hypothetical protein
VKSTCKGQSRFFNSASFIQKIGALNTFHLPGFLKASKFKMEEKENVEAQAEDFFGTTAQKSSSL